MRDVVDEDLCKVGPLEGSLRQLSFDFFNGRKTAAKRANL